MTEVYPATGGWSPNEEWSGSSPEREDSWTETLLSQGLHLLGGVERMAKDKTKPSLDKLLLDNVSNKYKLILLTSKLLKEKTKKDGKIKMTPETIIETLYEVASKDTDQKKISKGKVSKEESVEKKKPEKKKTEEK